MKENEVRQIEMMWNERKQCGTKENEMRWMETTWNERKRSEMNENDVKQKETIDLLLFAGIEPTGTMFQTINNLLLMGIFTTSV